MLSFSHSFFSLSCTLQGAGAGGGIFAVIKDGAIAAHYEYSPFGEVTAQSGGMADDFAFRFSTKYYENETGIVHYEKRPYSPSLDRWLSRDPIAERGGLNLYGTMGNDSINRIDYLGYAPVLWPPSGGGVASPPLPDIIIILIPPSPDEPFSQYYADVFTPLPSMPVFEMTGGEQHYGENQHENYIVFYITCPKCETAVGIQPDYSDVASCLRNHIGLFWQAAFDNFVKEEGLGGSMKGYPQPSSNCNGEPLEMRVYMRMRFVNNDYLSTWTGTRAWGERIRKGYPSPEVARSCYKKTKLEWMCKPCKGENSSTGQ